MVISTFIQIGVTDTDPKAAQDIANAIATELSSTVTELSPEAEDGTPAVRIETISRAVLPAYPSSPITAIGLLAGRPAATAEIAEIADSNDVVVEPQPADAVAEAEEVAEGADADFEENEVSAEAPCAGLRRPS